MMKKLAIASAVLVLLLTEGFAPHAFADNRSEAAKILSAYRTEDFLRKAIPCMDKHLASLSKTYKIEAKQQTKIRKLFRRIYPAKNLYATFLDNFLEVFTVDKIPKTLEFLSGPKGSKLQRAYRDAYSTGPSTVSSFYDKNADKLLTTNRRNAILTFLTATGQERIETVMEARCELGIVMARNAFLPASKRFPTSKLKSKLKEQEVPYYEEARKNLLPFDFFMLRDHTLNEITELNTIYTKEDSAIAFVKAYRIALEQTLEQAALTLANQLDKK